MKIRLRNPNENYYFFILISHDVIIEFLIIMKKFQVIKNKNIFVHIRGVEIF
jgi:hypothetical protein